VECRTYGNESRRVVAPAVFPGSPCKSRAVRAGEIANQVEIRRREPSHKAIRLISMDYRILRIMLGAVLLLVAAFALGTRLAEWDQERVQPEPPPAEMEDGKKPS